jgi:dihydrofolate synthase/folylpolyglutamate synthase
MSYLHPLLEESLEIKSMKLGLDRMESVDRILNHPSKQFPSVLVAGTNGKGSVTTKIATALIETGKKIGLYTSPHIHSFHERIQINGQMISDERADFWLKKIVAASSFPLPYFELMTLLAFCYFAEEKVDFAVLEVGMGGRLDATNIVIPVLSIITSIEMDHMAHLGNTLEKIAFEKAGIIKPGIPVLIGPHVKPIHVIEQVALGTQSPIFQVRGEFAHYEEENQAIAAKALELLPFPIENKSIKAGLAAVPPCRFEIISQGNPIVILDVAHNPDGFMRTFERLRHIYPQQKIRVLAGFSADKSVDEIVAIIKKNGANLHLTHTDHVRLLPVGDPSVKTAFEKAFAKARKNREILLVCGTFFIMDQARLAAKAALERGDG